VVVEAVRWADAGSRFTQRFEELVAWLAQRCDKTTIQHEMRIAWRTVGVIIERVVARRRSPVDWTKLHAISVDELSYRKGHHYLTLVTDLERGRIIWSKEGRSAATLIAFFREIGYEARAAIQHVAIDMSAGYRKAIEWRLRNATIVFDRFHVQQLASKAVDEVRRDMCAALATAIETLPEGSRTRDGRCSSDRGTSRRTRTTRCPASRDRT